jgi:hypothetical protein
MRIRRFILVLLAASSAMFCLSGTAFAAGGSYTFQGGTPFEQQQVRSALAASSFNYGIIPETIIVTIAPLPSSEAIPGQIFLDPSLLDSGQFSWGTILHEFAHEVDFELLNDADHAQLETALGGTAWCYGDNPSLQHNQYGCERFASTIAWAYWPNANNCMKPSMIAGESGGMAPAAFRALIASMLGPNAGSTPTASASGLTKTTFAAAKKH